MIRAATMATLVMGGKAAGVVLDGWAALGGAVAILLTVSGDCLFRFAGTINFIPHNRMMQGAAVNPNLVGPPGL